MKHFVGFIFIISSFFSVSSHAEINSISEAINESGRLRMLSQRLAKTRLLISLDIQPSKAQKQYENSKKKFESNLKELTKYVSSINNSTAIEISLKVVTHEWTVYQEQLIKTINKKNLNELLTQSDRILAACEELVAQLEKSANFDSAQWVNTSGRQRMLSQRIAKLYSAISLFSGNAIYERYIDDLEKAVNEFDAALVKLIASPVNTHFINHKLKKVSTQWKFSKRSFRLLNSGTSTPLVISMTTETMLNQMNDITALYQDIAHSPKKIAAR